MGIFVSSRIIVITIIFRKELSGLRLLKLDKWLIASKLSCCGVKDLSSKSHLHKKKKNDWFLNFDDKRQ